MSDEENQDETPQNVDDGASEGGNETEDDMESTETSEVTSDETFGTDSDVDAGDASSGDEAPAGFDASALPEIEANFDDENLNDLIRRSLTPITDELPCGENEQAASSVISQIETTIDSIHESLRTGFSEAVRDDNSVGFDISSTGREAGELVEQIVECLEEQCKSTVLASYLPQLMLIEYGLPGFSAGLDVFRELLERFEGHVFPRDREKLMNFLRRGVFVGNDDKVTENFKLFLYQPITEIRRLPYALLRNSRIRGANTDVEGSYANDAASSSVEYYVKLIDDLNQLIESAKNANQKLGTMLEDPMFEIVSYSFVDSLERMSNIVTSLATDNCSGYPPVEAEEGDEAESSTGAAPKAAAMTGEIVNREQAIDLLNRIADFFHQTERHSPVSYRIRETVRWCKMDLPELLQELLSDDQGPLDELGKRVGFRAMDSDESQYDG
ncbi:MAG: type VI secretion system ImpA family N-terminal domain-containing protein [Planctomycetota bacterium]